MLSLAKFMNHLSSAMHPPDRRAHVKIIDLSEKAFVPEHPNRRFVARCRLGLKLLSKMFLKPLVSSDVLWQFVSIRTAMLSHLGCPHPWPRGCLDASPDANETRYQRHRPQTAGGTGDSRLTSSPGC